MKKINIILTLLAVTLLSACQGLDEKLYSTFDANSFYQTTAQLQTANYQMYAAFSMSGNDGWERNMHFISTPLSMYSLTANNEFASFITFEIDYTNLHLQYVWSVYYNAINQANEIIKYAHNVQTTNSSFIAQHIAEARFIRGYSYYCLTVLFGDVPMRTSPVEEEKDAYVGCTSMEEILEEVVLPDLNFAVENLPYKWGTGATQGRATKKSARLVLAKVYLQMAGAPLKQTDRYEDVINTLLPMMNNRSEYFVGLVPGTDMATLWDGTDKGNNEILLCWGSSRESYGSQMPFFMLPRGDVRFGNIWTLSAQAIYGVSQALYDLYESNDLRRAFIARTHMFKNQNTMQLEERTYGGNQYNITSGRGMGLSKYTDPLSTGNSSSINDKVVYRFAEALLVMAEACNETGRPDLALPYLNEVRKRANATLSQTVDQETLRAEIRQERILELVGEWSDIFDIRRLDEGAYNWANHHYINDYLHGGYAGSRPFDNSPDKYQSKWNLYPIPAREINFNTEISQNNPGW